jgi:23S rRNA (guanosine2251-2'-O)-methyltransferase
MESNTTHRAMLILCDIRSNENVGSLFRTADALGIETILLSGITPSPIDRFGRPVQAIAKTALGAEKTIPWKRVGALSAIKQAKEEGWCVVAIEQSPKSIDYKVVPLQEKMVFVLGNEVEGLPSAILTEATIIAEIPMKGKKESLNVAVAAGVALFRILDR